MSDNEPSWVHSEVGDRAASVINVELGKGLAVVAICAALCGIAVPIAFWAGYTAIKAERETRMLQYYVNEVDGKLIHAGFIAPRDRWSPEKRKQLEGEGE